MSEATRNRILVAARDEFVAMGFAGARVDRIADKAGANKALIYRYFDSKDGLFHEILAEEMAEFARRTADAWCEEEPAGVYFDAHIAMPDKFRLGQWQALEHPDGLVAGFEDIAARLESSLPGLRTFFERTGVPEPADLRQLLVTLIGVVRIWFDNPVAARWAAGADPYAPEALARRRAHVNEIARRMVGLKARKQPAVQHEAAAQHQGE